MKLIRFSIAGSVETGLILDDGRWVSTKTFGEDYDEAFFGSDGLNRLSAWAEEHPDALVEVSKDVSLLPPIARPSKLICIGLNYAAHARESGMDLPAQPVVFFKATSAIVGPNDDLIIPRGSTKTDWEVELAVVISKTARYVEESDAMDHVAGYLLHNDYSERAFQLEQGGQWVKGKSCDSFAPLGPFLATKDEIEDPHNLHLWLKINGELLQNSNTNDLIFGIPSLVSYLSRYMTLLPGDVISTGTPSGVGLGLNPPRYLKPGDVVELGIEGLGSSRQVARQT